MKMVACIYFDCLHIEVNIDVNTFYTVIDINLIQIHNNCMKGFSWCPYEESNLAIFIKVQLLAKDV